MPQPPWLRRLDFLLPWEAWALGLGAGALAGAALLGSVPGALGVLGFLAFLGAAAGLAASGEPIAVLERVEPSSMPPREQPAASSLVDLVEIPGGSFLMGSSESEGGSYNYERPAHQVQISPFVCMRFPVTRHLYKEVVGKDPGWPQGDTEDRPVTNVSWFAAVEFCNRLSEREGLTPCYQIDGEVVSWQRAANGYRLLTEAEWEYACRAGTKTQWSFGDDEERLDDYAWFGGNSKSEPQPVGRKRPNSWGLHDLHGNVLEWCWDWFGSYSVQAQRDPTGPEKGPGRSVRGGSFDYLPRNLRSAARGGFQPLFRYWFIGFRCARSPRRQL